MGGGTWTHWRCEDRQGSVRSAPDGPTSGRGPRCSRCHGCTVTGAFLGLGSAQNKVPAIKEMGQRRKKKEKKLKGGPSDGALEHQRRVVTASNKTRLDGI